MKHLTIEIISLSESVGPVGGEMCVSASIYYKIVSLKRIALLSYVRSHLLINSVGTAGNNWMSWIS